MRVIIIFMAVLFCLIFSCKEEVDTKFIITDDQVSYIVKGSKSSEIEKLFPNDSVVRDTLNLKLGKIRQQIRIYEKGGAHLLTITPAEDSLATVSNIRINDPRFKTPEGIGLSSTFKEIETAYPIRKVSTAMNNVVLFLKNSDLYVTIDKNKLPENVRYSTADIEAVQIPDNTGIKFLMVSWD